MELHPAPLVHVPTSRAAPRCPRCEGSPELHRFRRYERVTYHPLWVCNRCYGFWATGDALHLGIADPYDEHPALRAAMAPRACRTCSRPLAPEGGCRRCKLPPPPPPGCPACGAPMLANRAAAIEIDHCEPCRGTWYDTGEIVQSFGLASVQHLAAGTVDETAPDEVRPALMEIAFLLLRIFLRF